MSINNHEINPRPIIIYGKYHKSVQGNITIQGDYAGSKVYSTLAFSDYIVNADENIALKYLWARKRIKLMSDYGIASNENDTISIEEEITQLGLKYNLITDYTLSNVDRNFSFLIPAYKQLCIIFDSWHSYFVG